MSAALSASPAATSPPGPDFEPIRLRPIWGELGERADPAQRWLWNGYLARGAVTLLTSQWKTGKTTLLSILLSKFGSGGSLAGQEVLPARAFVLSEEGVDQWRGRHARFGVWPHVGLACRPLRNNPSLPQWRCLIEEMRRVQREQQADLMVIDSLAMFLPHGSENQSSKMLEALRPLERLTETGAAVLLLHHPRKGQTLAGQSARGSGALCAYADILMELHHAASNKLQDRRRRLYAWSRHEETPRELLISMNEDGRDYSVLPPEDEEFEQARALLLGVLGVADKQLTLKDILMGWPERRRPHETTLHRWLQRAVQQRHVLQDGTGRRSDPFRYWLPGRDLPFKLDPILLLDLPDFGV